MFSYVEHTKSRKKTGSSGRENWKRIRKENVAFQTGRENITSRQEMCPKNVFRLPGRKLEAFPEANRGKHWQANSAPGMALKVGCFPARKTPESTYILRNTESRKKTGSSGRENWKRIRKLNCMRGVTS